MIRKLFCIFIYNYYLMSSAFLRQKLYSSSRWFIFSRSPNALLTPKKTKFHWRRIMSTAAKLYLFLTSSRIWNTNGKDAWGVSKRSKVTEKKKLERLNCILSFYRLDYFAGVAATNYRGKRLLLVLVSWCI